MGFKDRGLHTILSDCLPIAKSLGNAALRDQNLNNITVSTKR